MKLRLPSLNIADKLTTDTGTPTTGFHAWINGVLKSVQSSINDISQLQADIVFTLEQAGIAITTANEAKAALAAKTAADSLLNSYVAPDNILTTALDGTTAAAISIAAHTRYYGDGTTVPVNAGTITGLNLATIYYVVYDDDIPREGGTVDYHAITDYAQAAQTGDRHFVGNIKTPGSDGTGGGGGGVTYPPGVPPWKKGDPLTEDVPDQ